MRIIAGFASSLELKVPRNGTRPTTDRVREAVFSALDARGVCRGARVLDLYCGSGSLGLEAASRGAAHVTLVDRVNAASRVAFDNVRTVLRAAPRDARPDIVVSSQPVQSFLGAAAARGERWDLVFADPPYDLGGVELAHALEGIGACVTDDATVVVERSARDLAPDWPDTLAVNRRSVYGETAIYYAHPWPGVSGR